MKNNKFGITSGNNVNSAGYEDRDHIDGYPHLLDTMQDRFNVAVASGKKLFTTSVKGLYQAYLEAIPYHERPYYTCHNCERFIEQFGGLVTINERGGTESIFWDVKEAPQYFKPSVAAMKVLVEAAQVDGVFITHEKKLGTPITGEFTHFGVKVPSSAIYRGKVETSYQAMAKKKEEYRMVSRAIGEYSLEVVETATQLLQSEALYRAEKNVEKVKWFKELLKQRLRFKNSYGRKNITWLAVANAPTGFTHIRSGSLGVLLDAIAAGLSFPEIMAKMNDIMNPTKYQRPVAAPKAGNIARAEKIFKELGLSDSLHRRFARKEELNLMWEPQVRKQEVRDGIFGHLYEPKPQTTKMINNSPISMTWEKFAKTVLPLAEEIEYQVKSGNDNFSAILTAVYPYSAPILQWDKDEQRNPFSWYVYAKGSSYSKWNVKPGYVKVTGITYQPSMWYGGNYPNQGKSVYFLLDGAKDTGYRGAGNAIFPETLKSELHEVRPTIEKYSKGATIEGFNQASACGIRLQAGSTWNAVVRVTNKTGVQVYKLDRWD